VEEGPLSDDGWLSVSVGDIDTEGEGEVVCVDGEEGMERAVEVRLFAMYFPLSLSTLLGR
jgi:hypothetical protein